MARSRRSAPASPRGGGDPTRVAEDRAEGEAFPRDVRGSKTEMHVAGGVTRRGPDVTLRRQLYWSHREPAFQQMVGRTSPIGLEKTASARRSKGVGSALTMTSRAPAL